MANKKVPIDVLPLLIDLYAENLKRDFPRSKCRCRMCAILRRLQRVMPPSREGERSGG